MPYRLLEHSGPTNFVGTIVVNRMPSGSWIARYPGPHREEIHETLISLERAMHKWTSLHELAAPGQLTVATIQWPDPESQGQPCGCPSEHEPGCAWHGFPEKGIR